jgi:hypothetical protein
MGGIIGLKGATAGMVAPLAPRGKSGQKVTADVVRTPLVDAGCRAGMMRLLDALEFLIVQSERTAQSELKKLPAVQTAGFFV